MQLSLVDQAKQLNESTKLATSGYIRHEGNIPSVFCLQTALYVCRVNRDHFGKYKNDDIKYEDQSQTITILNSGLFLFHP